MTKAILSPRYPVFAERLKALGFEIVFTEEVGSFIPYEKYHADMQCLITGDHAFVLSRCKRLQDALATDHTVIPCGEDIDGEYPRNIALNALILNNKLIGLTEHIDEKLRAHAALMGFESIRVKQGYTRCSCAVVGDHAVITADRGIANIIGERGDLDVLLISPGHILLDGAAYGFIGGACGYYDHKLYCCGDLGTHPDADRISAFCNKHDCEFIELTDPYKPDTLLTDIGGIVFC